MKSILNNRGNATILCATFLFLFSLIYLGYLSKKKVDLSNMNQYLNLYLCHKALNTYQAKVVDQTLLINRFIRKVNISLVLATIAPPVKAALKKLKKLLQYYQEYLRFSFLKKIAYNQYKGCQFDPRVYRTPFKGIIFLKRDFQGLAILRSKKWNSYTRTKAGILKVQNKISAGKISQRSKLVLPF